MVVSLAAELPSLDPNGRQDVLELTGTWRLKKPLIFFPDDGPLTRLLQLVDDQLALLCELCGWAMLSKERTKILGLSQMRRQGHRRCRNRIVAQAYA